MKTPIANQAYLIAFAYIIISFLGAIVFGDSIGVRACAAIFISDAIAFIILCAIGSYINRKNGTTVRFRTGVRAIDDIL